MAKKAESTAVKVVPDNKAELETVAGGMSVADVGHRMKQIELLMKKEMRRDIDYGVIRGTKKPTLLKPGAEKLGVMFQLGSRPPVLDKVYDGDNLTVEAQITLFHIPTDRNVGTGVGSCSTREKKYQYRNVERFCPSCNEPAVRRSTFVDRETGEKGWYCSERDGGCKLQFGAGDERITSQKDARRIVNPDLPDEWNTVLKMAVKRAKIDGILAATGASQLFTQDLEDRGGPLPGGGDDEDLGAGAKSSKPVSSGQIRLINGRANELLGLHGEPLKVWIKTVLQYDGELEAFPAARVDELLETLKTEAAKPAPVAMRQEIGERMAKLEVEEEAMFNFLNIDSWEALTTGLATKAIAGLVAKEKKLERQGS